MCEGCSRNLIANGQWKAAATLGSENAMQPFNGGIDGLTGAIVCVYKALSIACRDCAAKNTAAGERRFYVRRPNGSRVTA
jgi:hypothetical protein